jgi:hypothetical protein
MLACRTRSFVGLLLVAVATSASLAAAQPSSRPAAQAGGLEARQVAPLVKAVDIVAKGAPIGDGESVGLEWTEKTGALGAPSASGLTLSWQHAVLKSADKAVYVPFVVGADPKALPAPAVWAYVRVVDATGGTVYERDFGGEFRAGGPQQESRLARAVAVPAGDHVAYLALRFDRARAARPAATSGAGSPEAPSSPPSADRVVVLRKELKIEDLWSQSLTTSTVFVADRLEALKAPLTPAALAERPFVVGAAEIVPSFDRSFRKTEDLTVFFQVYNAVLGPDKKPSVSVEYLFERVEGESFVNFKRVPTQSFNARTLPPNFDVELGHQLSAGWAVPLASFPVGDYRLAITIADQAAGTSVSRYVTFTVAGS